MEKGRFDFTAFEEKLTPEQVEIFRPYMMTFHAKLSQIEQLRDQIKKLGANFATETITYTTTARRPITPEIIPPTTNAPATSPLSIIQQTPYNHKVFLV